MRTKTLLFLAILLAYPILGQQPKNATPLSSNPQSPNPQSAIRAVVVGISDYQDPAIPDLRFADKDAEAFANFLRSPAGGSLDKDHLQVLTNQQATAGQVAAAFDWLLEQSKEGDQAIIYFSGHGDVERKTISQPGFLLCWDSPARVYMGGGTYSLAFLQEIVSTLSTQNKAKVVVITDACHAGKLAGSQIGGAQATAANLAKQFANEIKILSCQPNEFSLEGEQWGGGRGIFSYHLVDGLYGIADKNGDGFVSLTEVDRYLEDHVTAEAAPQSQIPMVVGNKMERLATVNPDILANLQKSKSGQMTVFTAIESRGLEDEVLGKVDSGIRQQYLAFQSALKARQFFEPAGICAEDLYAALSINPLLAPLHGFLKRNYAAALQDDAQLVINQLLRTDPQIVDDAFSPVSKYDHLPTYLHRAAELLGNGHYMYRFIKAREYYFMAKTCRKVNYSEISPDSLQHLALARLDTALLFDAEAAYAWFEKGYILFWSSQIAASISYFEKATVASPLWLLPRYYAARALAHGNIDYEAGIAKLKDLVREDSSFLPLYRDIGVSVQDEPVWFETYIRKMNEYISDNPNQVPVTYYNYLGNCLMQLNRNEEAVQVLLYGAGLSNHLHPLIYINLGRAYCAMQRYEEAETAYQKSLELSPLNFTIYFELGCLKRAHLERPPQEAIACFRQVVRLLPNSANSWFGWLELTALYIQTEQLDSAEQVTRQWIRTTPNEQMAYLRLGQIYRLQGKTDAAREQFQKTLSLQDEDADANIYFKLFALNALGMNDSLKVAMDHFQTALEDDPDFYFRLAIVHSFNGQNESALQWLEKAFQNGWKPNSNSDYNSLFHSELYNLRHTTEFKALVKKYFPDQVKD